MLERYFHWWSVKLTSDDYHLPSLCRVHKLIQRNSCRKDLINGFESSSTRKSSVQVEMIRVDRHLQLDRSILKVELYQKIFEAKGLHNT